MSFHRDVPSLSLSVTPIPLIEFVDHRGLLTAAQYPDQIPFVVRRIFTISDIEPNVIRGGHAHRECHQLLIPLGGRILVRWEGSEKSGTVVLDTKLIALHIPPLVWAEQEYTTADASLLVLASHEYELTDYMDDPVEAKVARDEYLEAKFRE